MASFSPSEKWYATGIYPEQERAMYKQFTASEVRSAIGALEARDMEYEAEMLQAYADRLEADEQAVPVAWARQDTINDDDGRPIGTDEPLVSWRPTQPDDKLGWSPLYTHPAPSDAERLAEALRNLVSEWVAIADDGDATLEDSTIGYRACADRLSAMLAATPPKHNRQPRACRMRKMPRGIAT